MHNWRLWASFLRQIYEAYIDTLQPQLWCPSATKSELIVDLMVIHQPEETLPRYRHTQNLAAVETGEIH